MYDFKEIEEKWQKKWEKEEKFKAVDFHPTKPKYYILYEFFNISGNLHLGHLKGTVPADALARMKRFQGYNVLFPIGGDSFGLPAENAAIKKGINPIDFVNEGMKNVLEQSKKIGLSFDYSRALATSDEEYYKWTQWIFLQLLKENKAYKEKGVVNFCPNCQTVLSNEDSQDGICDRCHGKVIQEERWVWFLKMKEYSEKLLENVNRINMRENLKELQRNWIGKTEGIELSFNVVDDNGKKIDVIKSFTSTIEMIYGVAYLTIAPEHNFFEKYKSKILNYKDILNYKKQTAFKSELERISNQKNITGLKVEGISAINPINGEKIPIYISDNILVKNGTGVSMAVPAHNQKDYEFAKKYNIDFKQVIEGKFVNHAIKESKYVKNEAKLINSGDLNNLMPNDAREIITQVLVKRGIGERKKDYKMQDWPFNRQRYWGEPFPVILCDDCGIVPILESELPVKLPHTNDYLPSSDGSSPLSKITEWVNCKCPKCGKDARRETDTMPNWAGSSWYWLRYCDPHNHNKLADYEKLKYWGSVDCYTGGTEHITRHVLYAFFWQNFLYEIGAVPTRDPFVRKMGSGLILDSTGKKMSKSSTNGVSPMEVIDKYGSDAARLHVHFLGAYEDNTPWTYEGITGITNFLNRVWSMTDLLKGERVSSEHSVLVNDLVEKVTSDIENLKLNTAIASCMKFVKKIREDQFITKDELKIFLILLNPLAPHITSEIYEKVFGCNILDDFWPSQKNIENKCLTSKIIVNVNNKKKFVINCPKGLSQEEVLQYLNQDENIKNFLNELDIEKIYFVQDRMINLIVNNLKTKKSK